MEPGTRSAQQLWRVTLLFEPSSDINSTMKRTISSTHIAISISDRSVRVPRARLERLIHFVAGKEKVRLGRIDLAIVSPQEIAALNRQYLRHAGPTDVLSFDLSDAAEPGISAQLIVCATVAKRQAPLHGMKPAEELMLYIIHGLLHAMGYDDTSIRAAAKMSARQEELLRQFKAKPTGRQE